MLIETFMPDYPDAVLDSEHFNRLIYQKKEFHDLKLSEIQPSAPEDDHVFQHQKIISRFLASFTLYDELFLFHSPGTGKTITAIHTIEQIFSTLPHSFRRAIILVPNETLVEKFKWEVVFTGTREKYYTVTDDDRLLPPRQQKEEWFKRGKKGMRPYYWITTHERFFNSLKKIEHIPGRFKSQFSNSIFVVDEAHRLLSNPEWYGLYQQCISEMENRKILLMSGTPMKNHVREIAPLMNLILPPPLHFHTSIAFDEHYLTADGHLREDQLDELSRKFTGRISYLKSRTNIPYTFVGTPIPSLTYPLYLSEMSAFQENVYRRAVQTSETFYKNSLQASLFVFPDESYGMEGFTRHVKEKRNGRFVCPILQRLQSSSLRQKQSFLLTHAPKFYHVIESILKNPTKNTFVYSYFMKGSGAILLGLCLELFGFTRTYHGSIRDKRPRYAILSDSIGTNVSSVLQAFNRANNKKGEYIQVLIGGRQVEEGITFYSVQHIHILTPTWNFSSLDQALARVNRMLAHRYLPPQTLLSIFLHAIVCSDEDSTDLRLYQLSQEKDYSIKEMEHLIKVSAFDCALTYDRNVSTRIADGSRECEYTDCIYRCKGIPSHHTLELDYSTYQIHYQDEFLDALQQRLQRIFQRQFSITLAELMDESYTEYQLFTALQHLIHTHMTFRDKYGFECFLHEHRNVFFLSRSISDTNPLATFYAEYPHTKLAPSFMDMVDYLQSSGEIMKEQVKRVCEYPLERQQLEIPQLHPILQEAFLENAVVARHRGQVSPLSEWILQHYESHLSGNSSTFLKEYRREFQPSTESWTTVALHDQAHKLDLIQSELGIYGYYNARQQFSITDLHLIPMDVRLHESTKRGKLCMSYTQPQLVEIAQLLHIPQIRADMKKTELCSRIEEWMKTQNQIL